MALNGLLCADVPLRTYSLTGMWFRSRRLSLEMVSRCNNISSRFHLDKNWQRLCLLSVSGAWRLSLGYLRLVPKTLFSTKLCKPH